METGTGLVADEDVGSGEKMLSQFLSPVPEGFFSRGELGSGAWGRP